jgi:hypothetical protein
MYQRELNLFLLFWFILKEKEPALCYLYFVEPKLPPRRMLKRGARTRMRSRDPVLYISDL